MIDALERLQIDYQVVSLIPFNPDIPKHVFPEEDINTICWGPSFVPRTLKHPSLSPGIWFDEAKFRWSTFRENWGDLMLCPNAKVTSLENAISNLSSKSVFMRPDEDSKAFNGGVFSQKQPPQLGNSFGDIQVVVAPVQLVENEWRFFVVEQSIVESSSYRVMGQPNIQGIVPDEATKLANQVIHRWGPSDVYCLDIGVSNGTFGVIEANCFNASRLYGANPLTIAHAVNLFVCT